MAESSASMKRSLSSSSREGIDRVNRSLLAETSCPTAAISRLLLILHEEGLLAEGFIETPTEGSVRKRLKKSSEDLARTETPFGPLVQTMELPSDPPTK